MTTRIADIRRLGGMEGTNWPTEAVCVDAGVGCAAGLVTECLRERKTRTTAVACCG